MRDVHLMISGLERTVADYSRTPVSDKKKLTELESKVNCTLGSIYRFIEDDTKLSVEQKTKLFDRANALSDALYETIPGKMRHADKEAEAVIKAGREQAIHDRKEAIAAMVKGLVDVLNYYQKGSSGK